MTVWYYIIEKVFRQFCENMFNTVQTVWNKATFDLPCKICFKNDIVRGFYFIYLFIYLFSKSMELEKPFSLDSFPGLHKMISVCK